MTKGRGLFRVPMALGGTPGAEPSAAGGQLRWVSLLDAGEGVAVLTAVLRPRGHTSTLPLCRVAWLGGLCVGASIPLSGKWWLLCCKALCYRK